MTREETRKDWGTSLIHLILCLFGLHSRIAKISVRLDPIFEVIRDSKRSASAMDYHEG